MRYDFELPDIGEGLTEATIASWAIQIGDVIEEDDPLCEIETDKAVVEITAPCSGTIVSMRGEPGETLKVGTIIVVFETEKLPAGVAPAHGTAVEVPPTESVNAPRVGSPLPTLGGPISAFRSEVRATPATRRQARENGIDLNQVVGTGPNGRILQHDVARFGSGGQAGAPPSEAQSWLGGRFALTPVPDEPGQQRQPFTGVRRVVAEQMVRSVTMIPHASSSFRCEAGRFVGLRKQLQERLGARISFTAMVMKAMVHAIQKYPAFNYSVDDTTHEIVIPPAINIGFATHTDDGLIVPVIKGCQSMTLAELSAEIDRLAELARTRKISPKDLRGGTITLSNVGSHGTAEATGGRLIVNHPQAAIIGITRIRPVPIVREGQVIAAPCLDIHTSYDHRIIDGIYAALFIEQLVGIIEEPGLMLAA